MDTQTQLQKGSSADAIADIGRRRISVNITARSIWLTALVVIAILVTGFILAKAEGTFVLLVIAIILGEAIRPIMLRLQRYHIPGPIGVLLVFVVTLAILGVLLWALVNPLVGETTNLIRNLPRYAAQLQAWAQQVERTLEADNTIKQAIDNIANAIATVAKQSVPSLLAVPLGFLSGIFSILIDLVIVLTMTIFWLMSSPRLKAFVVGLFPTASQEHAGHVISEVGKGFGGYVRGTLVSMVLIGLLSGIGLALLGVPYALLLGVLAGLTELLPYLGPWISGTVAVLIALITVDPLKAIEVAILFVVIQEVEGNAVQPLVMSRTVHVDPLLVIVSVLIGIDLFGVIGAILAVPLAAGVQVLVVLVLAPAIRRASTQAATPQVHALSTVSAPTEVTQAPDGSGTSEHP